MLQEQAPRKQITIIFKVQYMIKSCLCLNNISFVNSKMENPFRSVYKLAVCNHVVFVLVNWHLEIHAPC